MKDMKLVVITGAGASRDLGSESRALPLMGDLSGILRSRLDERRPGLADAIGLPGGPDVRGDEFEASLGEFFELVRALDLEDRFAGLAGPDFDLSVGHGVLAQARSHQRPWIKAVNDVLNEVLFGEFGPDRIDGDAAVNSFRLLLEQIEPGLTAEQVVFATTNYDPSMQIAVEEIFDRVTIGGRGPWRGSSLDFEAIELWSPRAVPVLHLHGAVGWYRTGDVIEAHDPSNGPRSHLGLPALLYPDPNKDPTARETASLWAKFTEALAGATHVLLVGHSLHDRPLIELLSGTNSAVGVLVYVPDAGEPDEAEYRRVTELLPNATPICGRFGPRPRYEEATVIEWGNAGYRRS